MAAANPDKNTSFKKGFPKEIINGGNVDPKYLCSLCELVLRNPIQSFCGHRFCASCIQNLVTNASGDQDITCPSCEKEECENEYSDLKNTFPDNAIKREFNNMTVKCFNEGCSWEGSFKSYVIHETSCDHQLFDCECASQIPKHQLEEHKQNQCPHRILYCPYCNASVMAKDMEVHEGECPMVPIKCQGCGREGMTRAQLVKHQDLETGDCEARAKICPLHCGKTVEDDLKSHLSAAPGDHIMALTEIVNKMAKKMRSLHSEGMIVADSVPIAPLTSSTDFDRLYRKVTDLEHRVAVSQSGKKQNDAKTPAEGSSGGATPVVAEFRSHDRGQPDGGDIVHKIKVTDTKVGLFEDTMAVLTQQLDSFREEADQLHEMNRELKGAVEAQDRKIKSLEKSIQLKDLSLAEADLKIMALEQTSYDGVMTWKITDFAKKRQDAIHGRMSSVYSPPFYTSKTGYKMCSRLYLNGDGMGKGTHLSLFFVVMKGTYDALLKWPFRQKVTLMLLDQNQNEHVVEAFRPDPNSSSFRRPTSDMNIASGCPLFCQLSQIDTAIPAYLKDDTMFLKIIVDPADL